MEEKQDYKMSERRKAARAYWQKLIYNGTLAGMKLPDKEYELGSLERAI